MTTERYEQILNNISEEYVDLGKTRFATKQELCEVVLRLRQEGDVEAQKLRDALTRIGCDALDTLLAHKSLGTPLWKNL